MTFTAQLAAIVQTTPFAAVRLAAEDEQFDADQVSPGVGGFLVVAVLAIAVLLLGFDLVRRLRRSRYRHEIREELAIELAERDAAAAAEATSTDDGSAGEGRDTSDRPADEGDAEPRPADER